MSGELVQVSPRAALVSAAVICSRRSRLFGSHQQHSHSRHVWRRHRSPVKVSVFRIRPLCRKDAGVDLYAWSNYVRFCHQGDACTAGKHETRSAAEESDLDAAAHSINDHTKKFSVAACCGSEGAGFGFVKFCEGTGRNG